MTPLDLIAKACPSAPRAMRALIEASAATACHCPPCPGRGNDGHKMSHCAECCFGTGVEADWDCPTHGLAAYGVKP